MTPPLIEVQNLSKKFAKSLRLSFFYGAQDIFQKLSRGKNPGAGPLRKTEFWALQDLNFSVKKGEILGVVGHNGAGKTTLLNVLTGIYDPSYGDFKIRGKLSSLITLGAGFNPLLSGRENIHINAAILGLSQAEINHCIDEIIEYTDIGEFIDAPLRTYSSGMRVRLGFSIATQINPDILLVDEILGVGDSNFRKKSMDKMLEFKALNKSQIVVSHNVEMLKDIADSVIILDHGRITHHGNPEETISKFEELMERKFQQESGPHNQVDIQSFEVSKVESNIKNDIEYTNLKGSFSFQSDSKKVIPNFVIAIRKKGATHLSFLNARAWTEKQENLVPKEDGLVNFYVDNIPLAPGTYQVLIGLLARSSAKSGQKWALAPRVFGEFKTISQQSCDYVANLNFKVHKI